MYTKINNQNINFHVNDKHTINAKEKVCPICNGLITLEQSCPNCQEILEDTGYIENLFGPYAPYEEKGKLTDIDISKKKGNCIHQIVCPHCDKTWTINVNKLDF